MAKIIIDYKEARPKIIAALNKIADPVVQTLSPMGSNTMYQDSHGGLFVTNDGVTIAKQVQSEDEIEDAIIEVVKHGALSTNREAGDGTTTTTGLTRSLVIDGMKLLDEGMNRMTLKRHLEHFGKTLKSKLNPIKIKDKKDLLNIARISSNNDDAIAKDVAHIIDIVGENGMVFINPNKSNETEIEEDKGYVMDYGMFGPDFAQEQGFKTSFQDAPVLITDKRLYYEEEAHAILTQALEAGHEKLVIVARDFLNKALNLFIANHTQGVIKLLLIKDGGASENDSSSLVDLATYLGGKCIREKDGKLVDNITPDDFVMVKTVYSTPNKSVFVTNKPDSKEVKKRVAAIKKEMKSNDDSVLEKRLAALTNGMVTIKVGGANEIEIKERIFRYEDAINATRSALKHGYLPGGGVALLSAYDETDYASELRPAFRRFAEFSLRQIAINCGEHPETILKQAIPKQGFGYDAANRRMDYMLNIGVIDPFKVTELAIENSVSIAIAILTSNYFIVHKKEEKKDGKQ
jgi:chaperonin GroEL